MENSPVHLTFDDVPLFYTVAFTHSFAEADGEVFATVSGDYNPLHIHTGYVRGARVVHGMHLASLFSRLIGMYCPGMHSLYVSQTLQFKRPVAYGQAVTVRGVVTQKVAYGQLIVLTTEIIDINGMVAVTGEAKAQFMIV